MPRRTTTKNKRGRQEEQTKSGGKKRVQSAKRVKENGSRTATKGGRRQEGRIVSKRSNGGKAEQPGVPAKVSTRGELLNRAKELGIQGRSRMSKSELEKAIRKHH